MLNEDEQTYYDLLEVPPDASPQEIRAGYLRAKSAYRKDSVALYTLISEEETEGLLRKIEEAYGVLSSPERRKDYDRSHGHLSVEEDAFGRTRPLRNQKIISIDRVPPMESADPNGDLLVPPATDFTQSGRGAVETPPARAVAPPPVTFEAFASSQPPLPRAPAPQMPPAPLTPAALSPFGSLPRASGSARTAAPAEAISRVLQAEIEQEAHWRGPFIRKVREARHVSIEELSDFTKITKTYLASIEDEDFAKLPAPVFLRGFVIQIAKFLKLPHDKVAAAYLARYNESRGGR